MSKFSIIRDTTSLRNVWYVMLNGSFVAGPFSSKKEAVNWIHEDEE